MASLAILFAEKLAIFDLFEQTEKRYQFLSEIEKPYKAIVDELAELEKRRSQWRERLVEIDQIMIG